MQLLTWFLLFCSTHAFLASSHNKPAFTNTRMASTELQSKPFGVIVEADIQPERMEEFLKLIQTNAENSRKEPGCIRFGASPNE
jgi:hypothetical protein